MKNSEAFYFIGHLIAIDRTAGRRKDILVQIESGAVDWDKVVKLASDQLVLPLLYVKLRDARLLNSLPEGLADHLKMVYDLNLKRNSQLLDQANEIANCLCRVGIKPIFIKGVANLLSGLYNDLGERMMLDIDFLVKQEDIEAAAQALSTIGYQTYTGEMYWDKSTKHYPRLTNPNRISDIEMHFNPASEKACIDFGYADIRSRALERETYCIPSDSDGLRINFLHAMYDNKGYSRHKISLRDANEVYLFSLQLQLSDEILDSKQSKVLDAYLLTVKMILGLNDSFYRSKNLSNRIFAQRHRSRLDSALANKMAKMVDNFVWLILKARTYLEKIIFRSRKSNLL
jgi:hypothetical protein